MNASASPLALAEQFQRDGFVVLENFLAHADLDPVNAALDEHWRTATAAGEADAQKAAFAHIKCEVLLWWDADRENPAVDALYRHPALAQATDEILGPGYDRLHTLIAYSLPGGTGQAWHQDCRAKDPAKFNVNRLVYTQHTTREDGAVVVVPGSHKLDLPVGGEQDDLPGQVIICPTAGTVVFLHGRCFHRVLPNRSARRRVSVNFRVKSPGTSENILYRPVYRHMTLDEREKFNAHFPQTD